MRRSRYRVNAFVAARSAIKENANTSLGRFGGAFTTLSVVAAAVTTTK